MIDDPTPRDLPLTIAANLLALVAGALLLCSQLTLIEVAPGDLDGMQLADRELRLVGVVWPALALSAAIIAGLKERAWVISLGLGLLMLTASYGVGLLVGYVDQYGFGTPPPDDGVRPTVLVVGVFSVAVVALMVWWIIVLVGHSAALARVLPLRVLGSVAFAVSFIASIVSSARLDRDFDIPLWPSLSVSVYMLVGAAAMLAGTRTLLVVAAAVAAARLAATFDLVVIRDFPWSVVADTAADTLVLVGVAVALVSALFGLLPPFASMRTRAASMRSKLELAEEWYD